MKGAPLPPQQGRASATALVCVVKKRARERAVADLRTALAERTEVAIWSASGGRRDGIPLEVGPFLVLRVVRDFIVDGVSVVPVGRLTEVRPSKAFIGRMLHGEGIADRVGLREPVDFSSFETLFSSLRETGRFAIVHAEGQDPRPATAHRTMFVGPVLACSRKNVWIHYFDVDGEWDDRATKIAYDAIDVVEFDSAYATVWAKYLTPRPDVPVRQKRIAPFDKLRVTTGSSG
jgi:hypothetical protein